MTVKSCIGLAPFSFPVLPSQSLFLCYMNKSPSIYSRCFCHFKMGKNPLGVLSFFNYNLCTLILFPGANFIKLFSPYFMPLWAYCHKLWLRLRRKWCKLHQKCFMKLTLGANVINLFTAVSYKFLYLARAFVPGKLFQLSLMFVGKARAYPSKSPFKCSTVS